LKALKDGATTADLQPSKTALERQQAPAVPAKIEPKAETTTIASDARIAGDITGVSHLVVKGQIEGNITGTDVVLAKNCQHKGDISAKSIEIEGNLEGNITADRVTLLQSAVVQGNINYNSLAMESGSTVVGQLIKQGN
jgi:Integral membrane protein CcmA involved in cell shape determination